nr:hypothetical protein [Modicisalibacter tunisiensis]
MDASDRDRAHDAVSQHFRRGVMGREGEIEQAQDIAGQVQVKHLLGIVFGAMQRARPSSMQGIQVAGHFVRVPERVTPGDGEGFAFQSRDEPVFALRERNMSIEILHDASYG